jgi:ABC-2 type transport system ATP-binding protein
VETVTVDDKHIHVYGSDNLLSTVVRHLTEQNITPNDLHAERATLEDAFLALTNDGPARSSPAATEIPADPA